MAVISVDDFSINVSKCEMMDSGSTVAERKKSDQHISWNEDGEKEMVTNLNSGGCGTAARIIILRNKFQWSLP